SISLHCNPLPSTAIHTLSLHDALPISPSTVTVTSVPSVTPVIIIVPVATLLGSSPPTIPLSALTLYEAVPPPAKLTVADNVNARSEEHTSELQSRENLVCRLLLEKKKT